MATHRRRQRPRSVQQVGLQASQLILVLNIIKKASRSLDSATFFNLLATTIHQEVANLSHVSVFEHDPGFGVARCLAAAGDGVEEWKPGRSAPPGSVFAEVISTGSPFVSNSFSPDSRGRKPMAELSRSVLCLPICRDGRVLALLNIESSDRDAFTSADVALFEILTEHLANLLQGVRHYEELRDTSVRINRITEICRRVFGCRSLNEALQTAVRAMVEQYGCYFACVAFVSEDGRWLIHQAHHALVKVDIPAGYRQEIGQGVSGRVVRTRRTVCCNDTAGDPGYVELVAGVGSELCIPLLADGALLGVLDLNAREANAFDGEDISLMETLARQLALVVDKSRFLDETRRARDYLENLIANAGDGILALDAAGRIIRWNQGMERIMGYTAGEILGKSFRELPAEENLDHAERIVAQVMNGETLENVEDRGRCKDGRIIDVMLTMSPIRGASGSLEGASVIVRDVTESTRMHESLRAMHRQVVESEQKFLDVVERSPDAVFFIDADTGTVVRANARAEESTGFARVDLIGRGSSSLHPAEQLEAVRQLHDSAVGPGAARGVHLSLLRASGPPLDVEVTAAVMAYGGRNVVQWVCRDISERLHSEKEKQMLQLQLLQTEKLSAIGQLISGVAHELNNPLTGVIGYAQLLTGLDCDEKIKRGLETVHAEARRCHRIVQNLLTFARKHSPEKRSISINDIIESTVELRSYQLRTDNVVVETSLSKDLPRTMGDFYQLQQVFMNILNNAHQSIKGSGLAGTLVIRTTLQREMIRIQFADNGPGIAPENLTRIFDPFFTTKPTGQGTGLGLSICFGIVEEHDGKIFVSSEPGKLTTFTVDLPVLRMASDNTRVVRVDLVRHPAMEPRNGIRLLVVDDEPSIVEVLSEALRSCGHNVDTAINGRLALNKIVAGAYDMVITDLKMPGMDGKSLYDEVRKIRPALADRFLFTTGDVIARDTRDFLERAGRPWLEKPFEMQAVIDLLETVRSGAL